MENQAVKELMEIRKLFPEIDLDKNFEEPDRSHYRSLFKNGVYLWGTGNIARQVAKEVLGLNVAAFIDNSPNSEFFEYDGKKIPVIRPETMAGDIYIVITNSYYNEIKGQLEAEGKREYLDFIHYSYLYPRPSDMINELLSAPVITDWKCADVYRTIRLEHDGYVDFCICGWWLKFKQGNAFLQSFEEIEDSAVTKLFRYSIESGKYCFCSADNCSGLKRKIGKFGNDSREWEAIKTDYNGETKIATASFDLTCNLSCESCRKKMILGQNEQVKFLKDYFIREIMPKTGNLFCAGQGEVFFSKHYREVLDCKSDGGLVILSNGNLADKEKIEKISNRMNGNVVYLISIDAAKKETYQNLRKGGNFDRLVHNLTEIGRKVATGDVRALILNFVISRKNYREIKDFVELGKQVGATGIDFTKIANWGTFTDSEFEDISMFDEKNEPKNDELKCILKDIRDIKELEIFLFDEWRVRQYISEKLAHYGDGSSLVQLCEKRENRL